VKVRTRVVFTHDLLLRRLVGLIAAPSDSERCGLPHEPVRVDEGPGIAAHREPVRSGAVGRDAGDLGEGTAVQERQLDRTRRRSERDIFAAMALFHGEAAVNVEPFARGHIRDSQLEHDLVDLRVAGLVSFFGDVSVKIVPSGACTTPP
jgi:hypothetical protein